MNWIDPAYTLAGILVLTLTLIANKQCDWRASGEAARKRQLRWGLIISVGFIIQPAMIKLAIMVAKSGSMF